MKLLLIDDHCLFLEGLAQTLQTHIENVEVLTAASVVIAKELFRMNDDIDLALVDLAMPKASGIDFIAWTNNEQIPLPVAILSASEDLAEIRKVIDIGAQAFIPKTFNTAEVIDAINYVLSGHIFLPEYAKYHFSQHYSVQPSQHDIAKSLDITPRQLEVLTLISQGYTNKKIANTLFISNETVKSHIKQLYQKLESDNRVFCINQAKTLGLVN